MKISHTWLQTFFDKPLPEPAVIADALTFHAFEIESVEGDMLDVKVTPNRGHDCLSYRGIAKEVSAIFQMPISNDPLAPENNLTKDHALQEGSELSVHIESPELCSRYIGGYIRGVKVGPSPAWLVERLAAMGQHSINNIVDATNFVMFQTGQPLHAFDAGKLVAKDGKYIISVRKAKSGEKLLALDGKEYELKDSMLVIVDGNKNEPVGIAGVKGGMPAGISESTTDIIIESANFNGVSVRKAAQALKLRTDASQRFEQQISPEFAGYGMHAVATLIEQLAGGQLVGFVDNYPKPQEKWSVSVSLGKINAVLGTKLAEADVEDAFKRLGLPCKTSTGSFAVSVPFERLDLTIPEDLIEEVARIVGYDKVPAVELPPLEAKPEVNPNFYAAEKKREELIAQGYSEVFTSVFADKGERVVANKVDGVRPFLRANLTDGLVDAHTKNVRNKDLLGLKEVKLFEIGTVWKNGEEQIVVERVEEKGSGGSTVGSVLEPIEAAEYENFPISSLERYKTFSRYPAIIRDIAMWVPSDTKPEEVLAVIRNAAGELLVRSEKFDEFKKGEKTSLAFHLVLQSLEKTLTDEEANAVMEKVYAVVKEKGWEVR